MPPLCEAFAKVRISRTSPYLTLNRSCLSIASRWSPLRWRSATLAQPKVKAVQTDNTDPGKRIILLREDIETLGKLLAHSLEHAQPSRCSLKQQAINHLVLKPKVHTPSGFDAGTDHPDLPKDLQDMMVKDGVEEVNHDLHLDYSHMSLDLILKVGECTVQQSRIQCIFLVITLQHSEAKPDFQEILPEGWEIPSSFESVGHIAHFNLRDEYLPYRHIIGQVGRSILSTESICHDG